MKIDELLHAKLGSFKHRLILWANELGDTEIGAWSEVWSNTAGTGVPEIEQKNGFSTFFFALETFKKAQERLDSGDMEKSLAAFVNVLVA